MEAIKLYLGIERCVFILGVDEALETAERKLAATVEKALAELDKRGRAGGGGLGDEG